LQWLKEAGKKEKQVSDKETNQFVGVATDSRNIQVQGKEEVSPEEAGRYTDGTNCCSN